MTTITFGGGPSLGQRRDFAGLKSGTHLPGYCGYCPQIKYSVGKTYGMDTHVLAQKYDHREPMPPVGPAPPSRLINELPNATGDNKYTKNMVPGYTGYIPKMPFKYGNTYKEDCDVCIDRFLTFTNDQRNKLGKLNTTVRGTAPLKPISRDPDVRDKLNLYRDTHPLKPVLMENKRSTTEPPIPGYQGFVPRIDVTELGLGQRFNRTTKAGFESFVRENNQHHATKKRPITFNDPPTVAGPAYTRRLYVKDGMIPKYTGYCPQRRFDFGKTYGDTTRSLEICHHQDPCFGDFMKTKNTIAVNQSM